MKVKKVEKLQQGKEYYKRMALLWWANLSKMEQTDFLVKRICNAKVFKEFLEYEQIKDITPLFEIKGNCYKYNKKAVKNS